MKLKRNLHLIDRIVRVMISIACIYFGFIDPSYITQSMLATIIGAFGVFNLFVVAAGHCPLYALVGLSTYKEQNDSGHES